jgi:hypothetical protein
MQFHREQGSWLVLHEGPQEGPRLTDVFDDPFDDPGSDRFIEKDDLQLS